VYNAGAAELFRAKESIMPSRRDFLKSSATAGFVLGTAAPTLLSTLAPRARGEAEVTPELVHLTPDVEPIVRLIEETPREKCVELMVEQLRRGLPYRNFLAALFLAGVRNVSPHPVGFKFHCVLAIHSANQLSLDAVPEDRLLPLYWALDQFKKSQADNAREGNFRMTEFSGTLPTPEKAAGEFHAAMQTWDEERATRAIAAFVRSRGADEVIEALWRYGARDFRDIGHKGIFVANSWRTLQTIGWRHAEPAMRSLVMALLDEGGRRASGTVSRGPRSGLDDKTYQANAQRAAQALTHLPAGWTGSDNDKAATYDLLEAMRTASIEDASKKTLEQLRNGKTQAQGAWDAVHLAAGELIMRSPNILGIHAVTSINALHYAFRTAVDPETRLLLLLHGVAWMGQFRESMQGRGKFGSVKITAIEPAKIDAQEPKAAAETLELVGHDLPGAAARAYALATQHPEPETYFKLARRLVFRKGTDAHRYKYAAAVFEDFGLVSPQWRPHMLATSVYYLNGSQDPDSKLMTHALDAVKKV
jgi:TAT (twin-arginine translocation) pathway signal sequence